jgi:hypothetical protein
MRRKTVSNSLGISNAIEDLEIEGEELDLSLINNWTLGSGDLVPSLEGLTIETLPAKYRLNLKRAVCRVEILRGESNVSMKYELFKIYTSKSQPKTYYERIFAISKCSCSWSRYFLRGESDPRCL